MFDAILMDFDGTVFDTAEGVTRCVQYALAKFGIDEPAEDLTCFMGPPIQDMLISRYGMSPEDAETALGHFRERYDRIGWKECYAYDGVAELALRLQAAGKKVALATSKLERYARLILETAGLETAFPVLVGATADGSRRAKGDVVRCAMEQLGADSDRTVLVGDRLYDVEGAHKCGIKCIGVEWGYAEPGEFVAHGADFIVRDVSELEKLLLG